MRPGGRRLDACRCSSSTGSALRSNNPAAGALLLACELVAVTLAGCTAMSSGDEVPVVSDPDPVRLLDAGHAAFTEVLGGAVRDDETRRLVSDVPDRWITGYAFVHAEASVVPDPASRGFRLVFECRRLFVEDEQRAEVGRYFGVLESDASYGQPYTELERRLAGCARSWLGDADSTQRPPG